MVHAGELNAQLRLVMIKYMTLQTIFVRVETRFTIPVSWQHCRLFVT